MKMGKKFKGKKQTTPPAKPPAESAPRQNKVQKKDTKYSGTPYNFVSLWNNVYHRYDSMAELPRHDKMEQELYSGVIRCSFNAETPVSVSDGNEGFFRDASGNYVLPGSTIKGLVRTNMMILGFGALRPGEDLDDVAMLYRAMADAKGSVKEPLREEYQNELHSKGQPPRVSACYVRRVGKEYQIYRSEDFLRVERYIVPTENAVRYKELREKEAAKKGRKLMPFELSKIKKSYNLTVPNPMLKREWVEDDAQERKIWYQSAVVDVPQYTKGRDGQIRQTMGKGERAQQIRPRGESESAPGPGWKAGILLSPGKMHGQNTLYLFPAFDPQAEHFQWSKEDRLAYEMDYKMRSNSLGGTDGASKETMERRKKFWKLPEKDGEVKPFFLLGLWEETTGEVEEDTGFERRNAVVVGRSPYLRINYRYLPSHGLPQQHRSATKELVLDYPYAVLGFASKVNEQGKEENNAYRSRVSFEDFRTDAKEGKKERRILAGPKPTSFPDYLENGANYNDDTFQLRGVKQYWLHEVNNVASEKENVASILTTLPAGTRFTGRIRFHNLDEDELGLLLWCLKLDEGCYQTVGTGKPYGFGRMSVIIDSVEQLCPEMLYSPNSLTGTVAKPLSPEEFIAAYENHIQSWLNAPRLTSGKSGKKKAQKGTPLRERKSIADFLYLHGSIQDEETVRYMELDDYSNREERLPTVKEKREANVAAKASMSKEDEYRRRKAECGNDFKALFALIQEFKANGWPIPED